MHWNLQGKVDRWVTKSLINVMLFPLIAIGIYLLMLFLPYLDPKKDKYNKFLKVYQIIKYAIIIFHCVMFGIIMFTTIGYNVPMVKAITICVSILFIIICNYLGKVKQNWFLGIKLPWTLANEKAWNKTHRLRGYFFIASGICGFIGLLFSPLVMFILLMDSVISILIISVIYSLTLGTFILYYLLQLFLSEILHSCIFFGRERRLL